MKSFITHRVVFIPSEYLAKRALVLAKKIAKETDSYFFIDGKKYLSHLTIYKAGFPAKNEQVIYERLEKISSLTKPLYLYFKQFFHEWGWVGLDFAKKKDVYTVHKKIVKLLNPLREDHISEKYLEEIKTRKYSQEQAKNIKLYGYPLVLSEYHPHLTLARYVDPKKGEKVREKYSEKNVFVKPSRVEEIAIVESGEHGKVTKFVSRFRLRG